MKVKEVEIGPLKIHLGLRVSLEECLTVSVDTLELTQSLEELTPWVRSSSKLLSVTSQNLDAN